MCEIYFLTSEIYFVECISVMGISEPFQMTYKTDLFVMSVHNFQHVLILLGKQN